MERDRPPLEAGWTLAGAACGLLVVVLVYAAAYARAGSVDPLLVMELHRRFPAFLVLDTAPLVLALVGLLAARVQRAERTLASVEATLGPWSDGVLASVLLDAAIVVDASGAVVAANRAALGLFGQDELAGRRLVALLPDLERSDAPKRIEREDPDGRPLGVEWRTRAVRAGGEELAVDVACGPASGRRVVYVLRRVAPATTTIDAEERDRLLRERDEARELNRAKGAFIASLSHELRTPLNAILGYADLLTEELADRGIDLKAELDAVRKGAKHLLSLVNSVLDLSKIEAGRLSVVLEPIPVAPIVAEVESTMMPLARSNGNELVIRIEDGVHAVRGDETRLRQVLINLVGNALKFTKGGTVTLAVRYDAKDGQVVFDVTDTGIGMTPEHLGRLFREYVQADSKIQKKYGGTGLGLALSKKLVELMGGSISVASELGRGSTFTVRLPFGSTQHTLLPDLLSRSSTSTPPPGAPIVIVDRQPGSVRDRMYKGLVAVGLSEVVWPNDLAPASLAALNPRALVLDCQPGDPLLEELATASELEGVPIVGLSDDEPTIDPSQRVAWLPRPLEPRMLLPVLRQADRAVSGCAVIGAGPDPDRVGRTMRRRGWQVATFGDAGLAADEIEGRRIALVVAVGDPVPSGFGGAPVVWVTHRQEEGALPLVDDDDALVDLIEYALWRHEGPTAPPGD